MGYLQSFAIVGHFGVKWPIILSYLAVQVSSMQSMLFLDENPSCVKIWQAEAMFLEACVTEEPWWSGNV